MTDCISPTGLSVCIPCIRPTTIEHAIESVKRQTRDDWELIIVVQGDDPHLRDCVDRASHADARIRVVHLPTKGVSRARNAGVQAASFDTFVFTDDDCEASHDWLDQIQSALDEQPEVGLVAGSLIASPRPRWRLSSCPSAEPADFTLNPDAVDTAIPPGSAAVTANLAVRRWAWDRVGGFDQLLGAGATFRGGEDLDLLVRAVREGIPVRFLPSAIVHHKYGRRFGVRAMLQMAISYGYGQGAVAGKMTHQSTPSALSWNGRVWRRLLWGGVLDNLRSLRVHRMVRALPRSLAFERSYKRCLRDFAVGDGGCLISVGPSDLKSER